ncbi:HDIG domain-containing protein [Clostridia bacterium]|nr:HDIG domain-containing protein [Clostridia bacterium]
MNRETAHALLTEYTDKKGLLQHAYSVEAAMKAYAKFFGEDEEAYGIVGLLHDFDYQRYPTEEEHPFEGAKILRGLGVDEEWVKAIMGHADYSGVARESQMAKTLFAVDELCGFIIACALVRPSKSLDDLKVKSVTKKLKDKRFAAAVSREDIRKGAAELGVELNEHISFVIEALRPVQESLDLNIMG